MSELSAGTRRPAAFGIATTINGAEVIDNDTGRPLFEFDTPQQANGKAWQLNQLVWQGHTRALARALRAD